MAAETRFSDYAPFLMDLGATGIDHFLEGGQAVNFWAEYFSAKGAGTSIQAFQPFTSKDCDVWVSHAAFRYIESRTMEGKLIKGSSPADGQVGVFILHGDVPKSVDLMSNVYGFPQARLRRLIDRCIDVDGIRVIDPISLFQSKCHCLLGLDQAGRQDEKHLRILGHLLPEHLSEALNDTKAGRSSQRALINEIKLLLDILQTNRVRRALESLGIVAGTLIPVHRLKDCGLTKVERFAASTFLSLG